MIGTILIAVIGYGLAIFMASFGATGVLAGIAKPDGEIFLVALLFVVFGAIVAAFTRAIL